MELANMTKITKLPGFEIRSRLYASGDKALVNIGDVLTDEQLERMRDLVNSGEADAARALPKLAHSGHANPYNTASIFDVTGGGEKLVGQSKRRAIEGGGYHYTVTNDRGREVYKGDTLGDGLKALAAQLAQEAAR
jgi:hypothetical protein